MFPSRNTTNLQQTNFYAWVSSSKFGLSEDEAKNVWQKQNIIANGCALPFVFLIGKFSDKISPKILVPFTLIFQIVVMSAYMFCEKPNGWYAYFLSVFQAASGFMIIVSMQGYAVKRVPKMIRGITMAVIISLSAIGGVVYLQLSKLFYESNVNMVFGLIAAFDGVVLLVILVSIFTGYYGDPAR